MMYMLAGLTIINAVIAFVCYFTGDMGKATFHMVVAGMVMMTALVRYP